MITEQIEKDIKECIVEVFKKDWKRLHRATLKAIAKQSSDAHRCKTTQTK